MTAPVFASKARNAEKVRNASAIIDVEDVLATLLWYQDNLGLQVEFAWGDPVVHGSVLAGATSFHFSRVADVPERQTAYMTLYVSDLDDLFDDIASRDVEVLQEPETMEWGMRAFMVRDLDGRTVMFADPSTGE